MFKKPWHEIAIEAIQAHIDNPGVSRAQKCKDLAAFIEGLKASLTELVNHRPLRLVKSIDSGAENVPRGTCKELL